MSDRVAELEGGFLHIQAETMVLRQLVQALILDMALKTDNPQQTAENFLMPHAFTAKDMMTSAKTPQDKDWATVQAESLKSLGETVFQQIDIVLKPQRPQ